MTRISALIAISSILSACYGSPAATPSSYRLECTAWDNVTYELDNDQYTTESCTKNIQCTGFDCSGIYQYQGTFSMDMPVAINYCFGLAIHPCNQPVNLHFYIDMPDQDAHFQRNVDNTTDVRIPGVHFSLPNVGTVDGFVGIIFERTVLNRHKYAKIGMTFKIRVQGAYSAIGEWPKDMQRPLMPVTYIPIPPCETKVVTPEHNPSTCRKYVAPKTMSHAVTSTTPMPTYPESKYMKQCKPFVAYDCGENMMCDKNVCRCSMNFAFNKTLRKCVSEKIQTPSPTPLVIDSPYSTAATNGNPPKSATGQPIAAKKNLTPAIVGGCIGGIVLVVGIIGVILFIIYRNHQRRYGNHQLLINNEEEEDDDPIDVST